MRVLVLGMCLLCACGNDTEPVGDAGTDASTPTMDAAPVDAGADAPLRRVLFVGNSYTEWNGLPAVIAAIGEASGTPLAVEMVTVGGATLYEHYTTTGALERVQMGGLDVVVLQGQSQEAGGPGWIEAAELWAAELTGTDTVWFATWPRHGDFFTDPDAGPAYMNSWIERGYADAAAINGDAVARVGAAWEIARVELPEVRLHHPDLSHPLPEGSLIAACVIHQTLTGRTPVLPEETPYGLELSLAEQLCALASRVTCPFEQAECGGECIPIVDDVNNCGGCGITCEGEDPCLGGRCGCTLPGETGCDQSYCAHFERDESDCGGCGISCSGGESCAMGSCECPATRAYDLFAEGLPPCHMDAVGDDRLGCNAAAHAHCAAYDCFTGGYGFPTGHAPTVESVACIVDTEQRTTTLSELATHEPSCADALTPACVTAIHRYCVAEGFVSGFGPIAQSGDELTVTCLPNARLYTATTETLSGFASRCAPDPVTCGVAAWNWCEAGFHPGGYGPVEPDTVVCF